MTKDADLISRADSLINAEAVPASSDRRENSRALRRRRSFIASTTPKEVPDSPAPRESESGDDEDLPVLTEVVLPAHALPEEASSIGAGLRQRLAAELAGLVKRQLRSELPALVESAALNAATRLQEAIEGTVNAAVRDFVTERGQLQLPLEYPDGGRTQQA